MSEWKWRFEQYCSVGSGRAAIADWRRSLSPARRAVFDIFLNRIAQMESWPTGTCDPMRGRKKGNTVKFWELRWTAEKVEHRILGYYHGIKTFAMLVGCTHKGRVYDPPAALKSMRDRQKKIALGEGILVDYEPRSIGDSRQGIPPWTGGRPN